MAIIDFIPHKHVRLFTTDAYIVSVWGVMLMEVSDTSVEWLTQGYLLIGAYSALAEQERRKRLDM